MPSSLVLRKSSLSVPYLVYIYIDSRSHSPLDFSVLEQAAASVAANFCSSQLVDNVVCHVMLKRADIGSKRAPENEIDKSSDTKAAACEIKVLALS